MAEFIVRLTDEQEALFRSNPVQWGPAELATHRAFNEAVWTQIRDALARYDQLEAETKAKAANAAVSAPAESDPDPDPEASTLYLLGALEKAVNDAKEARRRGRLYEQDGNDVVRERARSRWIRPEEWTPELGAAVEEMLRGTGNGE